MELKQNPFSFYDFLGYFTPGAILLYGLMAAYAHSRLNVDIADFISSRLSFDRAEVYIPFVLLSYTCGHLIAFLSSITVERYSIWALGYPSKYLLGLRKDGYYSPRNRRFIRIVMRTLVAIFMTPITLMDVIFGAGAGLRGLYAKELDPLLVATLRQKTEMLMTKHAGITDLDKYGKANEHDFFRYAYHYAVENSANHLSKMQNYVALYGFLRALTLLSIIIFWGIVWHLVNGIVTHSQGYVLLTVSTLVSYLLFMAFVKFYRRFSLEALMAMAVSFSDVSIVKKR